MAFRFGTKDGLTFRDTVDRALQSVERILDDQRKFKPADSVDHTYEDKFGLAELSTNAAIIAISNALEQLGLTIDILRQKISESADGDGPSAGSRTKTLRFHSKDTCTLEKTQKVEDTGPTLFHTTETTTETTDTTNQTDVTTKKSIASKIVRTVEEYHWKVDVEWEVSLYSGTDVENRTTLQARSSSKIIITQNKRPDMSFRQESDPIDLSLNWLIQQLDLSSSASKFSIDRYAETTRTPRRNEQVQSAVSFMHQLRSWAVSINAYFIFRIQRRIVCEHHPLQIQIDGDKKNNKEETKSDDSEAAETKGSDISYLPEERKDLATLANSRDIFCPVLPIFEVPVDNDVKMIEEDGTQISPSDDDEKRTDNDNSRLLAYAEVEKLTKEQVKSMEAKLESLSTHFRSEKSNDLISIQEAELMVICYHIQDLVRNYVDCVSYIENMLKTQLIAAIGKEVGQEELDEFVKFHNTKLLTVPPKSFCRNVRRPGYYPEGVLSITQKESELGPIEMMTREIPSSQEISVPINASTSLNLSGNVYLHGWLRSRFRFSHHSYELNARARQFSSFVLMVGTMSGPTSFKPQNAIIVQNKDEVIIPLILEEIPSAKEFKDAIQSLSPEMQQFAKSFRNMQLSSSVFGVCIVQIKPQLERLLGLPDGSLTKEIKLTQDLMELFVEYQVPSDLFTYDATESTERTPQEMVGVVKGHVDSVMDVISNTKYNQLEDMVNRQEFQATKEIDNGNPINFQSITGMPAFQSKSFEELRFDYYKRIPQRGRGDHVPFGGISVDTSGPITTLTFGAPAPAPAPSGIFGTSETTPLGGQATSPAAILLPSESTQEEFTFVPPGPPGDNTTHEHDVNQSSSGFVFAAPFGSTQQAKVTELAAPASSFVEVSEAFSFGPSPPPAPAPPSATGFSFGSSAPAPAKGGSGLFGSPAPAPSSFGAPSSTQGFGFGSAPAPSSGLFGSPAPAPALGAPAAAPSGGLFGSPAPSGGLFGAPAPSGGLFGAPAPSPFGAPVPASSSGLFGSPAPAPAFGSAVPSPLEAAAAAPSGGLFGAPAPSPFGAPAAVPSGGLFGAPAEAHGEPPALAPPPDALSALQGEIVQESTTHTSQQPKNAGGNKSEINSGSELDFTDIPKHLDSTFEKYDKNAAMCSNTVKVDNSMWRRSRQENLLCKPVTTSLSPSEIKTETNKAFDLLDALSKSGSLSIACSEMHVIISATHRFDNTVMGTLIEENVDPIQQLEKSTVLFASTIYGCEAADVIQDKETFQHLIANDTLYLSSYKKYEGNDDDDDDL